MSRPAPVGPSGLPVVHGIELISVKRTLPDAMRTIFPYPFFNAMQSKCVPIVFHNDDNFVLSSPTGSGKTVILELAICRLMSQRGGSNHSTKIVYQAPTKSLCSERNRDWQTKFNALGLRVEELTGDTESASLKHVHSADIIITTPEKWDSLTRKWKDHRKLMELIKLFLIDEVHILKEDRGASLEAVVSRMKSTGNDVRFIALSATVPNSDDIAKWLGKNAHQQHIPAAREVFSEEFRPVKLQKHVIGMTSGGSNEFHFDGLCTQKLPNIITTYTRGKPILVFCFTRRSTETTAAELANWWRNDTQAQAAWPTSISSERILDSALQDCFSCGVAFHHAGLQYADRLAVEKAYKLGSIGVICCTSTLAAGVNLPCHFVIMKNTVTYHQDGGIKEYSDLETMQMLGRAGRPQFDRDAIAVILTRQEKVRQYESLIAGQEIIESRLHLNLLDHLNAEVCLGTIHDTASAQKWLSSTFLFVRLTKNHRHYHIQGDEPGKNLDERAEQICRKGLKSLLDCELIEGDDIFRATEVGQAMARYYVQFGSMKLFLGLQRKAKMSEILSAVAQSQELKAVRFRQGDKGLFKEINGSPMTRFPIKVDLAMSAHRVSLIIQATLGGIDLKSEKRFSASMQQYLADQTFIFQHAQRFVRCIVDCQVALGDSISIRNALELERSLAARAWDDTPMQLTQLEGIGLAAVRKLANGGIASVEDLADTDALKIDMIMSRNPPFGANLLNKLKEMPKLRISLRKIGQPLTVHGRGVALNVNAEVGFLNDRTPTAFRKKLLHVSLVAESSDGVLLHFCRLTTQAIGQGSDIGFTARLTNPEQIINCYVSCDEIAGTLKYATLRPKISPALFPSQGPGTASTTGKYVSNSAPKRPLLKAADSHTIDDFDYEDDDIDDTELMNVTHREGFHDIDDYGEDSPISVRQNSAVKQFSSNVLQTAARGEEPRRLPNGKWACHHKCKDKDRCRHLCCNEGLDKAPRTRKNESIAANANVTDYQGFSKLAKPVTSLAAEPSVYIAQANTQKKRAPSKNASLSQEEEPPNKKRTNPIFTSNGKRKRPMLSSSSDPLHLSPFSSPAKGKGLFLSSSTIPHKVSAETVDLSSEGPRSPMQEPAATFGAWDKPRATKRDIDTATKAKVDHDDNDDNSSFHFGEVDQDASPRTRRFESVLPSSPREASGNLYGTDDFDTIDELEVQTAKPTNPSAGNDGSRLAFSNMDVNIQGRMQGAIDQDKLNISQDIDPWILEEFGDIVEFV